MERDPEKMGGVPTVRAGRLAVDSIVENYEDGVSEEEIAEMFGISLDDVRIILTYSEQAVHIANPV